MAVASTLQVKTRADLASGELIRLRRGQGNHYAIVLGTLPNGATTMVMLSEQPINGHSVRLADIQLDQFVVSLGQSWVVEVIDDPECYIRNNNYNERIGAISIDPSGTFLRAHSGRHFDGALVNLETYNIAAEDHFDSIAVPKWRLWVNDEVRKAQGSIPLLDFDLTAPMVQD